MRIAVDATCWHNRRGYGRHARALLRALAAMDTGNRYTLFTDSADNTEPWPERAEVEVVETSALAVNAASADGRRSIPDMWRMSRALSAARFDLVLFPTVYTWVPVFGGARVVVMVHDVIAETFPQLTVPRLAARLAWDVKGALGRWQADALVTVSDYSRDRIVDRFGMNRDRVFVVGESADPIFRRLADPVVTPALVKAGIVSGEHRTIAYLGGFSPHKNLEALVRAFARVTARPEFADLRLVMVGDTSGDAFHTYFGTIAGQVAQLGLTDRVVFTGYLKDEDVVVLLNLAAVLVLPSLMEGFGLPAVEAAACGCPVIATDQSPLAALLGEGAISIRPVETEIECALEAMLSSEETRLRMSEAACAAAGALTWENAARQMMEVIQRFQ
ncbi:MAG TPA: glycosyltransferase family 1 protein [Bryobacteraceae bacterium]|nr:glycosyltransferase family 1 protein [Bryobacteraceae bacterium]